MRQSLRWSPEELGPEVDPEVRKRANCIYRLVVLSQFTLAIVYFSMLVSAFVYHFGGDELGALAFAAAPVWMVALMYVVLALGFVRAVVGTVVVIRSSRCGSLVVLFVSVLVVLLSFTVLIFGILRAGGSGVVATEVSPEQFADGKG